jgi:hypothetical protein
MSTQPGEIARRFGSKPFHHTLNEPSRLSRSAKPARENTRRAFPFPAERPKFAESRDHPAGVAKKTRAVQPEFG